MALGLETMCTVAATLVQQEIEPDVHDLVDAVQDLIRPARDVIDRGLNIDRPEYVRCGSVMIELVIRGLCAAIGAPYDAALAEVARAQRDGDEADIHGVLVRAGLIQEVKSEAANS